MIGPDFNGNAGGLLHPQYGLMDVPKTGWQYAVDGEWIQDDSIMVLSPKKSYTQENIDPVIEMTDREESPEDSGGDDESNVDDSDSFTMNYQCGIKSMKPKPYIIGGEETEKNEWPWMASIVNVTSSKHHCGATLISHSYLITAAHCFHNFTFTVEDFVVRLGDHDMSLEAETRDKTYTIETIIIHEDYVGRDNAYEDDIAIIKLKEKVMFSSNIWPICLPEPGKITTTMYNEAFVTGKF